MAQYVLDTNVLLRAAAPESAQHPTAVQAVKRLLARGDELLLVPQVLIEFWCVATRPLDVNGYGWTARDAEAEVTKLLEQFPLLPETPDVFDDWLRLVIQHAVVGKQVHDARIVAMLRVHGIANLLTLNVQDFRTYGIHAVSPEAIQVG
jgi:predicted nucleic acid-binding protein